MTSLALVSPISREVPLFTATDIAALPALRVGVIPLPCVVVAELLLLDESSFLVKVRDSEVAEDVFAASVAIVLPSSSLDVRLLLAHELKAATVVGIVSSPPVSERSPLVPSTLFPLSDGMSVVDVGMALPTALLKT
jgi:hypothetical protein